jgi:hypothetical protein
MYATTRTGVKAGAALFQPRVATVAAAAGALQNYLRATSERTAAPPPCRPSDAASRGGQQGVAVSCR